MSVAWKFLININALHVTCYSKYNNAYWHYVGLCVVRQNDRYSHVQFSTFFSATPETPLPSPPQGSGQEQYKITANQASVISHQSLSKPKQLWKCACCWLVLCKCETHWSANLSGWYFCQLLGKASSWCSCKLVS